MIRHCTLTLPGVAVTMPCDGTKPPVGGGGGGPPIPEVGSTGGAEVPGTGTVPIGSGDGWYRGGCEGDERFTGNDESGTGADGGGGLVSVITLYVRSGMPSTPGATGGTAAVKLPAADGGKLTDPAAYWPALSVNGTLPALQITLTGREHAIF